MKSFRHFLDERAKLVGMVKHADQLLADEDAVSKNDLNQLEKLLDKMFKGFNIDIEFTRHFLDRVNDSRNKEQITVAELKSIFADAYAKYAKQFSSLNNIEAVLVDIQSDINIPFRLEYSKKSKMIELISKTVMRKKGFKTSNRKYNV